MCLAIHSNLLANNAYFLPTDSVKEPQLKTPFACRKEGFYLVAPTGFRFAE